MTYRLPKRLLGFFLIVLCSSVVAHLVGFQAPNAVAIFLITILLWFTELLPLPATGVLVPVLIARALFLLPTKKGQSTNLC